MLNLYGITISLSIFLCILITQRLVVKYKKNEEIFWGLSFWTILCGILGARLYHVLDYFDYYRYHQLDIFKIWNGGMGIWGGILGGVLGAITYLKIKGEKIFPWLDIISVVTPLGQSVGRWGNFFNGEAHGGIVAYETLKKFFIPDFIINGMKFGEIYYQPTFLYESLWCLLGFVVILLIRRLKYIKIGQVTCSYLIWYGVGRFFIEGLRTDSLMFGSLRVAQIVSIAMVLIGFITLFILGRGSKFSNQYNDVTNIDDVKF